MDFNEVPLEFDTNKTINTSLEIVRIQLVGLSEATKQALLFTVDTGQKFNVSATYFLPCGVVSLDVTPLTGNRFRLRYDSIDTNTSQCEVWLNFGIPITPAIRFSLSAEVALGDETITAFYFTPSGQVESYKSVLSNDGKTMDFVHP